jgi:hypothetical protein
MLGTMPSTLEYTPPWNRSISFTIFKMHNEISREALVEKLKLLEGNIEEKG